MKIKHHVSHNKKTYATISGVLLLILISLCALTFSLTQEKTPHTSELGFIEHSNSLKGSVVPASCESGFSHNTIAGTNPPIGECDPRVNVDFNQ
jgi:hypothetical protein